MGVGLDVGVGAPDVEGTGVGAELGLGFEMRVGVGLGVEGLLLLVNFIPLSQKSFFPIFMQVNFLPL